MSEFISMRAARGRIEAKLLVDWDVSIEHPIAVGNHPLIAHLLEHGTVRSSRLPWDLGAWGPVKGCRVCALLKAHQLVCEAMEEDEDLQEPNLEDPQDLQDLDDKLQELEGDALQHALQRWLRGEDK